MSIVRDSEDDLSTGPLSSESCRCISILPTGGTTTGRATFDVSNSCSGLDVSVGFAGDIARVAPRLIISAWADAGILKSDMLRQVSTPEGWTIASIAGYRLRNKSGTFTCRLDGASMAAELNRKRRLSYKFTSYDRKPLSLKFYSQKRNVVWPDSNTVWKLENGNTQTYNLSCEIGEKICYGAWRDEDETVAWGVGRKQAQRCEKCCHVCAGGEYTINLDAGPDRPPANQLTIEVKSLDPYPVELSFFNEDASRAWPGNGQIYPLNDSAFHTHRIGCRQGEKICYGAWRRGNSATHWGVGRDGQRGCSNCCMRCGSGRHQYTLNAGPENTPTARNGSGGIGEVLGGIATGLAVGTAIGSAIGGGGGGGVSRPPAGRSPPSWSGNYEPGRSGISGGR